MSSVSPLIRELANILFIHLGLAFFAYNFYDTVWGKGADKAYDARMKSPMRWFLMPGSLSDRKVWCRQQRIMVWLMVPLVIGGYVLSLISLFRGEYIF